MNDAPNRRKSSRVPVQLFVEIRQDDICLSSNKTHDVSMRGLFVHTGKTLSIGSQCHVKVALEGRQPNTSIELVGRVVRRTKAGMAIEFQEGDLESYERLRNLVLFNSPDPGQVEKEVHQNPGFKPTR